jgi:hypothetical protein
MLLNPATTYLRLVTVFAAAAALVAGCATARVASGWVPSAMIANGIADDWADMQVCSKMKDGLQLSVANDAERLYVMAKFRANAPQWSRAASMGGLTLRVVGPGKRTMSFRLPEGPERPQSRRPGWSADSAQGEMLGKTGDSPSERLRLTRRGTVPVFLAEFEGKLVVTDVDRNVIPVNPDGSQGPAAGFSSDDGMCIYEFSVPLQDTAFGHYTLGAGAGAGLNLTVTAGPSAAQREAMRGEMLREGGPPQGDGGPGSGGMPGGRGGFGNGGPGRGGPQGGPPGVQAGTANPSVEIAVRLAVEP